MEVEKERNIYYLHPDFEMETENKEKKPSPLALLAQTCQSIGSGKDCKYPMNRDKSCSPNSTTTTTKRSIKRANSDYLSNSSNSPLIEQVCSPPTKKIKPTEIDTNCNSRVELNHADTSSDIGKEINQSLMNSFMNFLKSSNNNNSQQSYTEKLEFLFFLTNRFMNHETNLNVEKSKDLSNFNITNGYNLKTQKPLETKATTTKFIDENNHNKNHQINSITNQSQSVSFDKTNSQIDQTPTSISTIKYCMYCGKLIPVLPMLLAHIKIDHGTDQFSEMRLQNFNTQPAPSLCDFLTKFNPYHLASQIKSNQSSSPVPSFTNYINNWSSLLGYENLIF